ncbi:MAG: radical SAM protein [Candidatus Omnitrophica bacterium]|nr:radical SAM protein [Candidatus Omnitrophota bacterium]
MIKAIKNSSKLCPHLHIPIQSGDDAVLKRMRRSYTHKRYLSLIQSAKKEIKGLAVTTDVIIGFPAETEAQFKNTVSLVKAIKPLKVHIFPYSPRPGTAAAGFSGQIAPEIIKDRMSRLKLIAEVASVDFRKQFVNINVDVLIEGPVRDDPKYLEGFTENYIKVFIPKRSYIRNDLIRVRLKEIIGDAMLAESCVA